MWVLCEQIKTSAYTLISTYKYNSFNVKFKFKKNSAYTPFSTYKYNLFNVNNNTK